MDRRRRVRKTEMQSVKSKIALAGPVPACRELHGQEQPHLTPEREQQSCRFANAPIRKHPEPGGPALLAQARRPPDELPPRWDASSMDHVPGWWLRSDGVGVPPARDSASRGARQFTMSFRNPGSRRRFFEKCPLMMLSTPGRPIAVPFRPASMNSGEIVIRAQPGSRESRCLAPAGPGRVS